MTDEPMDRAAFCQHGVPHGLCHHCEREAVQGGPRVVRAAVLDADGVKDYLSASPDEESGIIRLPPHVWTINAEGAGPDNPHLETRNDGACASCYLQHTTSALADRMPPPPENCPRCGELWRTA